MPLSDDKSRETAIFIKPFDSIFILCLLKHDAFSNLFAEKFSCSAEEYEK